MKSDPTSFQRRARLGYELARLLAGLRLALWVVPLLIVASLGAHTHADRLLLGAALFAICLLLGWRGQAYGRAVVPGLFAGLAPMLLPLVLRAGGHCCMSGSCWTICMVGCICGGLIAGGALGFVAARQRQQPLVFLASSGALAVLTGTLGCAAIGSAGIVGMLAGMFLASVPALWLGRARSFS
jgi:hypothetical protein